MGCGWWGGGGGVCCCFACLDAKIPGRRQNHCLLFSTSDTRVKTQPTAQTLKPLRRHADEPLQMETARDVHETPPPPPDGDDVTERDGRPH